ncbi:MAG TPA: hypothetical protein VJH06_01170 [Candidatus Paceibacterota bacterium]
MRRRWTIDRFNQIKDGVERTLAERAMIVFGRILDEIGSEETFTVEELADALFSVSEELEPSGDSDRGVKSEILQYLRFLTAKGFLAHDAKSHSWQVRGDSDVLIDFRSVKEDYDLDDVGEERRED